MSTAQHTGLAFLLSQHVNEQVAHETQQKHTVVIRNAAPKTAKVSSKPTASKGEVAAPIHEGPKVFGVTMPDRNTLDSKGFLQAMLKAGSRISEKGARFTDPKEVRNDQIQAIHAYCGYDSHRDFGSQESEARAKAHREIRGYKPSGPTKEELRAASRSAAGFVSGLPDHKARTLANLQAREQAAAEAMIGYVRDSRNHARPMTDRKLSLGLAMVERDRLKSIRADIKAMSF